MVPEPKAAISSLAGKIGQSVPGPKPAVALEGADVSSWREAEMISARGRTKLSAGAI